MPETFMCTTTPDSRGHPPLTVENALNYDVFLLYISDLHFHHVDDAYCNPRQQGGLWKNALNYDVFLCTSPASIFTMWMML